MNNLKEINIKNHTCYYFDDVIKIEDLDFDNILLDEKSYKNILVYDIQNLFVPFIGANPLLVRFDKVHGFIGVYDRTRYLVLIEGEKYDFIYNNYISYKNKKWYTYVFSRNYAKIKVDLYDSLPLEKTLIFYYVIIHIKSVWNRDINHYYYNVFLEKVRINHQKILIINKFLYKL